MPKNRAKDLIDDDEESIVEEVTHVQHDVPLDEAGLKKSVDLSMEAIERLGWKNKSQIIRGLYGMGYNRVAIAKFLGVRYQHVRNVLVQPLKRGDTSTK